MSETIGYVLLGDSDPDELLIIQELLEYYHLRVEAVDNCEDVLKALQRNPQPDVVILDAPLAEGRTPEGMLLATLQQLDHGRIPVFLLIEQDSALDVFPPKLRKSIRVLNRPFSAAQFLLAAGNAGLKFSVSSPARSAPPAPSKPPESSEDLRAAPPVALTRTRLPTPPVPAAAPSPEIGWELRRYWTILLRRKWLLLVVTIAAVAVSIGISQMLTPIYEATATIRVASAAGGQFDYGASVLATRLANTYVEIATSTPILDELITRLGIAKPPKVEVKQIPETELLEIAVRHADPAIARDAANTLANIMVERSLSLYAGDAPTARELMEAQLAEAKKDLDQAIAEYTALLLELSQGGENSTVTDEQLSVLGRQVNLRQQLYVDLLVRYEEVRSSEEMRSNAITVIEYAELPKKPASPNLILNAILGASAGAIGGLLLVIVLESFRTKVTSATEIQSLTGLPVIARIPSVRRSRRRSPDLRRIPDLEDPFQSLQVRLQLSNLVRNTRNPVILVTSPEPGTGKTTVAVNLALSMARAGNRVILVDADLHRPSVHKVLNIKQQVGLSDILTGDRHPETALKPIDGSNLRVLTSGLTGKDTTLTELISPYKIELIFRTLAEICDYLIVDSPALLVTGYSVALARQASATVLVTAQNHTDRGDLESAMQQLAETNANVIGVVINRAESLRSYAYRYKRR